MSFIRGGETITIKRRSATSEDDYGNPVYTTTNITIKDALIAVSGTDAPVSAERDAIDAKISVYLPLSANVQDDDVFVIRGSQWVMDGTSQKWVPPFAGLEGGQMIPVRQRRG
jgi:hypothetical protein